MMEGNKLEELRELVEFLKANGIAEFDMEQDDLKVRIKFAGEPAAAAAGGFDMAQLSRLMASAPAAAPAAAPPLTASASADPLWAATPRAAPGVRAHRQTEEPTP